MSEHTIYVSHTREVNAAAERLTRELTAAGFSIAGNVHTVQAGRRLKPALKESMTGAARFLACFFSRYGAPTEYETDEVALAIEQSASRPEGELWLIPVKLTPCEIPPLQTPHGNLAERAAIDLHGDWTKGMERLLASLPLPQAAASNVAPAGTGEATSKTIYKGDEIHAPRLEVIGISGANNGRSDVRAEMTIDLKRATLDESATFIGIKR